MCMLKLLLLNFILLIPTIAMSNSGRSYYCEVEELQMQVIISEINFSTLTARAEVRTPKMSIDTKALILVAQDGISVTIEDFGFGIANSGKSYYYSSSRGRLKAACY